MQTVLLLGDGQAYVFKTAVTGIAMQFIGAGFFQYFQNGFFYGGRGFQAWITQAEIIDVFCTVDGSHLFAFFKHGTDGGAAGYERFHFICNHRFPSCFLW